MISGPSISTLGPGEKIARASGTLVCTLQDGSEGLQDWGVGGIMVFTFEITSRSDPSSLPSCASAAISLLLSTET